jgi:hypothetical protein
MASLNAAGALTALANVDVELAVNGLARDVDLKLLGDVGFVEGATTIGANVGQGCLVDLIDLFDTGRSAVSLGAVVLARFSARLARIKLGLALGEGTGLALAGTECRVELATQALGLGLQVVNPPLKRLAIGTPKQFHTRIIRRIGTCS